MLFKRLIVSVWLICTSLTAWSLDMKSVTVAGFINKGSASQDQVNLLMIKSFSAFLSKISKNITPYKEVEKAAAQNNFWKQKELDTDTAIRIAQNFSSEQVITGDYTVNEKKETIFIHIFVYNVITGKLLLQRDYTGSAGVDIFDTIDKMTLEISGLLAGKPIELGTAKINIKPEKTNYKLYINDEFVKLINKNDGFSDNFVAGQPVNITLKTEQDEKEVLKQNLMLQNKEIKVLDYNPSGTLIVETMESGQDIYLNRIYAGRTDDSGELRIQNVSANIQNILSSKKNDSQISSTNITIREADLKIVILKKEAVSESQEPKKAEAPARSAADFSLAFNSGFTFFGLMSNGYGYGGSLEFTINKNMSFEINVGFADMNLENSYRSEKTDVLISMGSLKYYFNQAMNGFYVNAGGGYIHSSITTISNEAAVLALSSSQTNESEESGFVIPAFIGYKFMAESGGLFWDPYIGMAISSSGGNVLLYPMLGINLGLGF